MSINKRIERLELAICPPDTQYGVLICGYRCDSKSGRLYMKDGKIVGEISSVLEWANGRILRILSAVSEDGKKILKELGYEIIDKDSAKKE